MRKSLTKQERVRRREDIRSLFAAGKSVSGGVLRLIYRPNGLSVSRVLITLPKKFGTAVERNRAQRLVKEAYRHQKSDVKCGYDIGCIVYQKGLSYTETTKVLAVLLRRAGLYEGE